MTDLPPDAAPADPRFGGIGIRSLAPVPGTDVPADAVPIGSQTTLPLPGGDTMLATEVAHRTGLGEVFKQIGYDIQDGFSNKNLDVSPETRRYLTDKGLLWDREKGGPPTIAKAFGEGVLMPLATAWNAGAAAMQVFPHAVGDAALALGVNRDIVSMLSRQDQAGSIGALNKLPKYPELQPEKARPETQGIAPPDISIPLSPELGTQFMVQAAKDLRVLQPDAPTIRDGLPVEAAAHAMNIEPVKASVPAIQQGREITRTATDKAGNIRLDLIAKPEHVLDVIRRAADENHGYQDARAGDIPLAHLDAVAQVMGTTVRDLNITGIGRNLQNDHVLRTYVQAMIQSAEEVAKAHADTALNPTDENMMKQLQLEERHAMVQEQVSGLTSEAGRTLRVLQEFGDSANKAKKLGEFVKENLGSTPEEIKARAEAGSTLDPRTQLPGFLSAMRKPGAWDKFMYVYSNWLVSGPFTHAAYAVANATFMTYEASVVTPIAGAIGAVTKGADRVYMGEGAARLWGMVAGTPDAFHAAITAAKTGMATPLPGQITPGTMNPFTRIQPIGGPVGKAIGVPGNVASAIHTFYNFLGFRASLEAQGYRQAVKDGYHPLNQDFWTQQKLNARFPQNPDKAFEEAVKEGQRGTFTAPLGEAGQALQRGVKTAYPLQLIFPFMRVPGNIAKSVQEGTPLAWMSQGMRDNMLGKNGAAARDTQWARLVGGSAIMGMAAHWAATGLITGDGPHDPKQRAEWLRTHQPNSVSIGGEWISYNKFGTIAGLLNIGTNLHDAGRSMSNDEYGDAAGRVVGAASHWMEDTAGLMSLFNLVEAMRNVDHKGKQYVANLIGSIAIPYSSFMRQTASMLDPQMRDTKAFVDALQNNIPFARERLLPLRDWTGSVVPNPRSGFGSIFPHKPVVTNSVDLEMQHLDLWPRKPEPRINGVQLTPEQYDRYQSVAGMLTREKLESLVKQDSWYRLNDYTRRDLFERAIESSRAQARATLQLTPGSNLLKDGLQLKLDEVRGLKPKPKVFERP